MVLGSRAPWAPNTINICWAPKMSWAPIASKKHVGSNGSPAHFGSPADIDGVGSPGSPGRPDRGGKPREPRRGKPRNSKRCWQHNRQLWTEAMCAKEQFFTKNFPFLILRTLREGLLDRLFPKCWHRQQKRGLTSAIIFLMDLSTMHWNLLSFGDFPDMWHQPISSERDVSRFWLRKKDFRLLGNKIGLSNVCEYVEKHYRETLGNVCRGKSSNISTFLHLQVLSLSRILFLKFFPLW